MKKIILFVFLPLAFSYNAFCQSITPGQYLEMTLAYNPETKILTGFYTVAPGTTGMESLFLHAYFTWRVRLLTAKLQ
ncbi:hypothetical protein BC343_09365 [Mucilaginibacter pedocola]|uniref:Uncharacterized protein n=1 Tax=Mucilaginibacter pedocola TaxID=1792845 RepID=A0A1S9PCY5_9SPHI|nr:hypothetical protein BC343_09365 [Mucilaginibacter pedocola]